MTEFFVSKSFLVPTKKLKLGGRIVDTDKLKEFWIACSQHRNKRGCYVFSVRAAKGELPFYVGKAAKQDFEKEVFALHKRCDHYNVVLGERPGTPRITFVVQAKERGRWSSSAIDEVEEYLIGKAAKRNDGLTNLRRLPYQAWAIKGVVASGAGKPSAEASNFKKLFGISN